MKFILSFFALVLLTFLGVWFLQSGTNDAQPDPVPQPVKDTSVLHGEVLRILVLGDPFGLALSDARLTLEKEAGGIIQVDTVLNYDALRALTLEAAREKSSPYDLVAVDVVWMGEYGEKQILQPLDKLVQQLPAEEVEDYLPIALRSGSYKGVLYALPIQPHPELLWYRKDLFAEAGLQPPQTTDELLAACKKLHKPEEGVYGICWNALGGQPLGQTMAHFYAAFGQPLLDENGQPTLDTPKAIAAANFAKELLDYSPPDILAMAWDERTARYAQGRAAMTYGWAARAFLVEEDPVSQVQGRTEYIAPPHAPGVPSVVPMGVWTLGIPANLDPKRQGLVEDFLLWLTAREQLTLLAKHGNGGMPRLSLLRDPALISRFPAFPAVLDMAKKGILDDSMRPAIPQWANLAEILGTVYHDMLKGELTPEEAAHQAQVQAEALFNK